ncbi:MAG TPA: hypothetical protein PLV68_16110, partial [Ilumatobacteraceae bacterium]|nr:hypothetical protein [Ilumatobacteraceae bacterium]
NVYLDQSELERADDHFRQGHVMAQQLHDVWHMAAFANLRATVAAAGADPLVAADWHRAAMSGWAAGGFHSYATLAATELATALARGGRLDEAAAVLFGRRLQYI